VGEEALLPAILSSLSLPRASGGKSILSFKKSRLGLFFFTTLGDDGRGTFFKPPSPFLFRAADTAKSSPQSLSAGSRVLISITFPFFLFLDGLIDDFPHPVDMNSFFFSLRDAGVPYYYPFSSSLPPERAARRQALALFRSGRPT